MNKLIGAVVVIATFAMAVKGADVVVTVMQADGDKNLSELAVSIQPMDTLIKKGDGRLIVTTELSSRAFAGNVEVQEGRLQLNAEEAIGTGRLTVDNGASVEIGPLTNVKALKSTEVFAEGYGLNGSAGAFLPVGSGQMSYMLGKSLTLKGDTLIKCNSAGFGPSSATINLNGNKLVLDSGVFECRAAVLKGPGEFVLQNGNTLYLENNAIISTSGTANDTKVTIKEGCGLQIGGNKIDNINLTKCPWWAVDFESAGSWRVQAWQEDAVFGWNGPVALGGAVTFDDNGKVASNILSGVVSGSGSIVKKGKQTLVLSNPANAVGGDVTVSDGALDYTGSIGGDLAASGDVLVNVSGAVGGAVTVSGTATKVAVGGAKSFSGTSGQLMFDLSGETVTDDILYGYWRGYTDGSTTELASDTFFDFGIQTPDPYMFTKALDNVIVSHAGAGTLTVTSAMSGKPAFKNYGGELVLAPPVSQEIGWVDVKGGAMTIAAGSIVKHPTNNITVAASYPSVARLKIKGTLATEDWRIGIAPFRNAVSNADRARGIVEVFEGAVVTNIFPSNDNTGFVRAKNLTRSSASISSYYQHGGDVSLIGGSQTHYSPGVGNGFYYSLEGGNYTHGGCNDVRFAGEDDNFASYGVFAQSGGTNTVPQNGTFNVYSRSSQALYYQTGGLFLADYAQINIGKVNWEQSTDIGGGRGYMTFDGPDALATVKHWANSTSFSLCERNNSLAEVNVINGATLDMNGMKKAVSGRTSPTIESAHYVGTRVRVNLNGGRIRLGTTENSTTIFRNFVEGTDHVKIYAGGAMIDTQPTDWKVWSVGASLETPVGNGVASIELSDEMKALDAWEYTGSPWVEIVDPSGVGTGATAVAVFDSTLGKVTGIRIMNRGENYPVEGVVATVRGGGYPNTFVLPCTVAPNVSGGLTKEGSGTLVLDRPCTYTGRTVLAGGTLKFGVDGAVRAESRFVLAGGNLDMDGKKLSDGSTAVTDWGVDVALAMKNGVGAYTDLAFPSGSTLTIEGADALPAEGEDDELKRVNILKVSRSLVNRPELTFAAPVTKGWHIRWFGQTIRASRDCGVVLIVR